MTSPKRESYGYGNAQRRSITLQGQAKTVVCAGDAVQASVQCRIQRSNLTRKGCSDRVPSSDHRGYGRIEINGVRLRRSVLPVSSLQGHDIGVSAESIPEPGPALCLGMNEPALLPAVLSKIAVETDAAVVRLLLASQSSGEALLRLSYGEGPEAPAGQRLAQSEVRGDMVLSLEAVRRGSEPPFRAAAAAAFYGLRPFMKRALVLAARLRLAAMPTAQTASVIMATGRPMATLDSDGSVRVVNPAALRLGLSAEAIIEAIGGSAAVGSVCRATIRNGSWTIRVDHGGARLFWRLQAHPPPVDALILDLDVLRDDQGVRLDLFSQTHALTRAERAVLELAVSGYSAEDIATDRQSSRETVRVQLRSIREKTGCSSLLAMTAAVTGFHVD